MSYFDNKINELVKENSFYTYKEILEKINNLLIEVPNKKLIDYFIIDTNIKDKSIEILINILTKYNIELYDYSLLIYINPTNSDLILNIAKDIYKLGGIQFLDIVFYILKNLSPYTNNNYGDIQIDIILYNINLVNRAYNILNSI